MVVSQLRHLLLISILSGLRVEEVFEECLYTTSLQKSGAFLFPDASLAAPNPSDICTRPECRRKQKALQERSRSNPSHAANDASCSQTHQTGQPQGAFSTYSAVAAGRTQHAQLHAVLIPELSNLRAQLHLLKGSPPAPNSNCMFYIRIRTILTKHSQKARRIRHERN